MPSSQTDNYSLNQWAKTDRIQMSDFNADNAKIDAALATIPQLVLGSYTGDGAASRTIDLGFTPRAAFVVGPDGTPFVSRSGANYYFGGLATADHPALSKSGATVLAVCEGGFQVAYSRDASPYIYTNAEGDAFAYIAIK